MCPYEGPDVGTALAEAARTLPSPGSVANFRLVRALIDDFVSRVRGRPLETGQVDVGSIADYLLRAAIAKASKYFCNEDAVDPC